MKLILPNQVAQILGVSVKTVHKLVREGALNCVEVRPRIRRFSSQHVEEFISSHSLKTPIAKAADTKAIPRKIETSKTNPEKPSDRASPHTLKDIRKEFKQW